MKLEFFRFSRLLLVIPLTTLSCQKESSLNNISQKTVTSTAVKQPAVVVDTPVISSWKVNWNNRAIGSVYSTAQAVADFGNIGGWNQGHAAIAAGKDGAGCRATLMPNTLSGEGLYGSINISNGTEYEMDYDVKFDANFNWGFGGKVGFGFLVGNGNTGGNPAWDGNGGSLRLMWFSPNINSNRVYFQPYLYYKDMNGGPSSGNVYGDTFGISYPSSGALIKGQWYHVHMYIKSNTGSNTDGRVQIVINGTTILDRNIRWTTNNSKKFINTVTFNTFRGGAQSTWETPTTDYVYYDNLVVGKIK